MDRLFKTMILGLLCFGTREASATSDELYIVGIDSSNNDALWITDFSGNPLTDPSPIELPDGNSSYQNAVACSLTTVYIAGEDESGNAALWVADLEGTFDPSASIELPTTPGVYGGSALNVAFTSSRVYIVGTNADADVALWITDLEGNLITTSSINLTDVAMDEAAGVACSATQVYIAGNTIGQAALWITDLDGNITENSPIFLPTSPDVFGGYANGVAVSSSRVYLVGQDDNNNSALWITDLSGNLVTTSSIQLLSGNGAGDGYAQSATLSSSSVYIVGTDGNLIPSLWITDLSGTATTPMGYAINLTGNEAQAYGVVLSSTQVFMSGFDTNTNNACFWVTDLEGNLTEDSPIDLPMSGYYAYDIAIASPAPSSGGAPRALQRPNNQR